MTTTQQSPVTRTPAERTAAATETLAKLAVGWTWAAVLLLILGAFVVAIGHMA